MEAIDFLPVLYAFVACLGFGGLYNLHGSPILWAAVGGALGWLVYLLTLLFAPDFSPVSSVLPQSPFMPKCWPGCKSAP